MTAWMLQHPELVAGVLTAGSVSCFAAARWCWFRDRPVVGSVLPPARGS